MSNASPERLRAVKTLPHLIAYLRDELGCPMGLATVRKARSMFPAKSSVPPVTTNMYVQARMRAS